MTTDEQQQQQQLPVLIVGAGPCGLTAAVTLQKQGVPFLIIKKVPRDKICSNAGSGFELTSTAMEIYKDWLGLDVPMSFYVGMNFMTLSTNRAPKPLRVSKFQEQTRLASVNQAELQNYLLEQVLFPNNNNNDDAKTYGGETKEEEQNNVLMCGSGIRSYEEKTDATNPRNSKVTVTLRSGKTIDGSVLLACDGINSTIRSILHGGSSNGSSTTNSNTPNNSNKNNNDPLRFTGSIYYWGKTPIVSGSDLEKEFNKTQTFRDEGATVIFATGKLNGFFVVPTKNATVLVWAFMAGSKSPPKVNGGGGGGDSTRWGGGVLTTKGGKCLFFSPDNDTSLLLGQFPLLKMIVDQTHEITEAGLFAWKNLDLTFSSKQKPVALLGDSAHPQTPALGQGVNMTITDAYVYATRIAIAIKNASTTTPTSSSSSTATIQDAISSCDTAYRRKQSKNIVKEARATQDAMNSSNRVLFWLLRSFMKYTPMSFLTSTIERYDKSNREYLRALEKEIQ